MKSGIVFAFILALACCSLLSFDQKPENAVSAYYHRNLEALKWQLSLFKTDVQSGREDLYKADFRKSRIAYKNIEAFVCYFFPYAENRMNGPAVLEVEPSDFSEINYPTGFQVIEEQLYGEDGQNSKKELVRQLDYLINYVNLLESSSTSVRTDQATVLDMVRVSYYAMASKGLSGFDSPIAYLGIEEAGISMQSSLELLKAAGITDDSITAAVTECISYLNKDRAGFNQFDRAAFLSGPFRRALSALFLYQKREAIPFVTSKGAVRKDVAGFLEAGAFDAYFFSGDSSEIYDANKAELGKMLFNETAFSLGNRSCASCHKPELLFTDGLKTNTSLQTSDNILRNTPTIINTALQPVFFYDGRAHSLEDQAHEVLQNKDEMDGRMEAALVGLSADSSYRIAFRKAFPDAVTLYTKEQVLKAIAGYERSLVKLDAPFDAYMRGNAKAMTSDQVRGFNLFMGKAKCGTCHYMPLFNGVVPPLYKKSDTEIIGVPEKYGVEHPVLDSDLGAYNYYHNDIKRHAFKTPGLRNVERTAPYMHNGSFRTLEEVLDFYDKGGGAGIGLEVPNQTLPAEKLNLSSNEKKQIVAFLKSLSNY